MDEEPRSETFEDIISSLPPELAQYEGFNPMLRVSSQSVTMSLEEYYRGGKYICHIRDYIQHFISYICEPAQTLLVEDIIRIVRNCMIGILAAQDRKIIFRPELIENIKDLAYAAVIKAGRNYLCYLKANMSPRDASGEAYSGKKVFAKLFQQLGKTMPDDLKADFDRTSVAIDKY